MRGLFGNMALVITGAILGAMFVVNVVPLWSNTYQTKQTTNVISTRQSQIEYSYLEISDVEDLPHALFEQVADSDGRMANPGENWNPIDVTSSTSPPQRRLLWATSIEYGSLYIVAFEVGGYVRYRKVVVAEYDGKLATVIWQYETKH